MFFGYSNALTIFQRYIIKILTRKFDIIIILYPDNILIYSKDLGYLHIKDI